MISYEVFSSMLGLEKHWDEGLLEAWNQLVPLRLSVKPPPYCLLTADSRRWETLNRFNSPCRCSNKKKRYWLYFTNMAQPAFGQAFAHEYLAATWICMCALERKCWCWALWLCMRLNYNTRHKVSTCSKTNTHKIFISRGTWSSTRSCDNHVSLCWVLSMTFINILNSLVFLHLLLLVSFSCSKTILPGNLSVTQDSWRSDIPTFLI